MLHRVFSERLNHELNEIGMPERLNERVETFAKVFKTARCKAEDILNGKALPDDALLKRLTQELEVSEHWLLGDERRKH